MACTHRAALKRCHELLQEAHAYVPENEAWHDQVTEILLPCDEAMECPTVPSAPAPQPWTEGELARAIGAEFMRTASVPTVLSASVGRLAARVALSRPLANPVADPDTTSPEFAEYRLAAIAYAEHAETTQQSCDVCERWLKAKSAWEGSVRP